MTTTAETLNAMSGPPALRQMVVYRNPSDYPGKFVVREWRIAGGHVERATEPTAVVDSIEQARACIPEGMINIGRYPDDDAAIYEVWV